MTRSFAAEDIVILPRLRINEAVALTTALLTRFASVIRALEDTSNKKSRKGKAGQRGADDAPLLPAVIMRRHGRVEEGLLVLRNTKSTRLEQDPAVTQILVTADRGEDSAWSGGLSWCQGWARIPFHETENQLANKLISVLYADGLKFTQLPYREQWAESQARLDAIEQHQLEGHFAALGGTKVLDAIRQAHADYGRAQGITSMEGQETSEPQLREHLATLLAALRRYVMAVANHADPDVPGSEALSAELLEPLTMWKSRSASASPGAGEDAGEVTEAGVGDEAPPPVIVAPAELAAEQA